MPIIDGVGLGHPVQNAGAPVAGTDEVQTITFGGAPTTDTFTLTFDGWTTAAIAWSNVNATLIAAIDTALEALPNIGTGGVVTAATTLTAGVGALTVTFSGAAMAKRAVPTLTGARVTGTQLTLAFAETTPGVDATARSSPKGAQLIDTTNGILYMNTGSAGAPTWTKVGTQT